ncbi:SET domain-containing protein [Candidatus Gracilibacteria bacterium]|nr:SET domain-containing protein [Candidatus Gracilibacteria bacterium]MCF7898974.1 SET domain-containing protein [Candidatus Paceibacterota bacterium]
MLTKQSKILKKGSKRVSVYGKATNLVIRKLSNISQNTKHLPDHHFKIVKVKRGVAGLGLFAGENIKKGELIIEYIGNILNKEEADKKTTSQYLFEITRNKTIDGTPRWNVARYCNHACEEVANAESEIKKGRVFIKAIKNIKEGEEICYDYGEEFVKEHIGPHGCRCVAKKHGYAE